jgi:acyl-CoA-dependent ceramide synthase
LLQIINLFWYFLILRILYRYAYSLLSPRSKAELTHGIFVPSSAVFGSPLADERSDEEDEAEVGDDVQEVQDEKADLHAKGEKAL